MKTTFERPLPCDTDAELNVLGSLMVDPAKANEVRIILSPEDFYYVAHANIYKAILAAIDAGERPEPLAIKNHFEPKDKFNEAVGTKKLMAIMDAVITPSNAAASAKRIKQKAKLREAIRTAYAMADAAYTEDDIDKKICAEALRLARELSRTENRPYWRLSDLTVECAQRIDKMAEKKEDVSALRTGFYDIDNMIGGLVKKDLVIIAARPSVGKTSLATKLAVNIAKNQKTVLIFSLETSKEQLIWRLLIQESRVNAGRFKNARFVPADWEKMSNTFADLSELDIYIDDTPAQSPANLMAKAKMLAQEKGAVNLIIVDYLQLMRAGIKTENRNIEVTMVSQGLKQMAKEMDCPVMALSQLSRDVEKRNNKRPRLSDLRDSGSLEQDGDIVIMIYRDEVYNKNTEERGIAEIIIEKQRNGPTGTVKLVFLGDYMRFENLV